MPSHRRTQLRRENSFDHSLDSPSDSARIVSFGGREPSVSPINPARTPSMFSAHDQSLLASPSSRGVFQSPFAADSPLLGLDQSPSFNSPRANDSIISKYHTRRLLFNEPSMNSLNIHPGQLTDTRENRLRVLRHDAMENHLAESAIFFAEKVMAITGELSDIHYLAHAYYQFGYYHQALDLLNSKKVINTGVQCRYLAAKCAMALENWPDALDYLGHTNPFREKNFKHNELLDGSIKLEAIMCLARGNAYLHLNDTENAKSCYKEALTIDVKCYDALEALVRYNMLDEKSEWEFIMTLPYDEHCESDSDMYRSLYILQLKKYSHSQEISNAQRSAAETYKLGSSVDVMQSTAETLLNQSRYEECVDVCLKIRTNDRLYRRCLPVLLTSLYELRRKSDMYELAQDLVGRLDNEAVTWYAVGMYYLCVGRYADARQHFTHSTNKDRHFEAAWLGLGHAFAAEHDHEQAINAYAECSKLVTGSHLPLMYIGQQHLDQHNMDSAHEFLSKSRERCNHDPFLFNEFGVYYYKAGMYEKSLDALQMSLRLAKKGQAPGSAIWKKIWENLGHTYRKLQDYDKAIRCFKQSLARDPQNANAHTGLGFIYHIRKNYSKAIDQYNLALRNANDQNLVLDLLNKALLDNASVPFTTSVDGAGRFDNDEDFNIFALSREPDKMKSFMDDELTTDIIAPDSPMSEDQEDMGSFLTS